MTDSPEDAPPDAFPVELRLLPWTSPEGRSALLAGSGGGFLAELADEMEELQLDSAQDVAELVRVVLDNPEASPEELRFAAQRLHESLKDTLRVARVALSRGTHDVPFSPGVGYLPGGTAASAVESSGATASALVRRWTHSPQAVGSARRELRGALEAWGLDALTDPAELVLSELLTNAVRHALLPWGREVETRYERTDGGVRIEVHDANETRPELQKPSTDAEAGRGLALVDALTGGRWGVSKREGVGKVVWAVCVSAGR